MSRESLPEMVDAYDTNTGTKVRVPKAWIGAPQFKHLSTTPKAKATDPGPAPKNPTPKEG